MALEKLGAIPVLMHQDCSSDVVEAIMQENNIYGMWQVGTMQNNFLLLDEGVTDHYPCDVMGALSSGTTGVAKVMYRTYESWAGFFQEQNKVFGVDADTVMFLHGSMSFTGNLNMFLSVMAAGGSVVTCRRISGNYWNMLIVRNFVTHVYMVPAKLQILGVAAKGESPYVKQIIAGSQILSLKTQRALRRTFTGADIILYYGSSELSYISYKHLEIDDENTMNLGKPFEGIRVKSVDGVLVVDTPFHVSGVQVPYCCDDTGYINDDGDIIFTGRKTDWINKGGYKISCFKLEQQIRNMDNVRDVAVLPFADETRGQDIAAFVVTEGPADSKQFRHDVGEYVDERERPKKLVFLEMLPLNDRGKVNKEALKELL
ncbi:Long-chain-fatty-acid--CoA ligase [Anaerovibrio sp. JC8]|uniref:AMP-binding protein n=1 Tax=Anaerovibrio sp. JC8 TaxID=1240085 RepID=UPI000A0C71F6|nr:AMP-binding protein [Anaerovibrio sp. JC8]ORT99967.1 Long-chain-fatty-acid--CoA ligase [Anaerovibrio sp. JC8]